MRWPGVGVADPPAVAFIEIVPIALFLIVVATVIPAEFRTPTIELLSTSVDPRDFVFNILLFVPLGAGLAGRRWYVVIAASGLLSLSVEVLQIAQASRHAGFADILANVTGGILGSVCQNVRLGSFHIGYGYVRVKRRIFLVVALVVAVSLFLGIVVPGEQHDFSNWDATYRLAISDEITRNRSWHGTLVAWAVYDRVIQRDAIEELADPGHPGESGVDFQQLPTDPVVYWKNSDPVEPTGFLEMSREISTKVHDRLMGTGKISLLAWFRVKDLEQTDLMRILTFSRDPFHRNFTLGQEGGVVEFRIRTPATGLNGTDPATRTMEILEPGRSFFVAATYDGFVSRVFVDGELAARENLASNAAVFPLLHDTSLPLVLAVCGACLGGALIVFFGQTRRSMEFLLGATGGLVVAVAIWAFEAAPAWPVYPVSSIWIIAPPLAGGLVAALSLVVRRDAGPGRSTPRSYSC